MSFQVVDLLESDDDNIVGFLSEPESTAKTQSKKSNSITVPNAIDLCDSDSEPESTTTIGRTLSERSTATPRSTAKKQNFQTPNEGLSKNLNAVTDSNKKPRKSNLLQTNRWNDSDDDDDNDSEIEFLPQGLICGRKKKQSDESHVIDQKEQARTSLESLPVSYAKASTRINQQIPHSDHHKEKLHSASTNQHTDSSDDSSQETELSICLDGSDMEESDLDVPGSVYQPSPISVTTTLPAREAAAASVTLATKLGKKTASLHPTLYNKAPSTTIGALRKKLPPSRQTKPSTRRSPKRPHLALEHDSGSESDLDLPGPVFSRRKTSPAWCAPKVCAPVLNPYAKKKAPAVFQPAEPLTPSPPTRLEIPERNPFSYPMLLNNSRQYPDLRAKFILALWKYARSITNHAHERQKLDQLMKRIVKLALSEFPVRSIEEFLLFGRSGVSNASYQKEELKKQLNKGMFEQITTPQSRHGQGFYSISEACLVAMHDHVLSKMDRSKRILDVLPHRDMWIPLDVLIQSIDKRLRPECPMKLTMNVDDFGMAFYLNSATRSAEFMQITKLESSLGDDRGPRIKRHKQQGKVHFELLEFGYLEAQRIKGRSFPSPKGHYRTSKIMGIPQDKYRNICLGVDRQEGGGGSRMLHEMCSKLDLQRVPYFVGTLAIGDYVFFTSTSDNGRLDHLCPVMIERKSVQDVAMSIHDGRWQSQKARMYKGQYIFGYNKCRMVFIIEGNENQQLVTGGYVGNRWHNVDKEKLHSEIDNLKSEGFEVMRTPSRENTMFQLARWAKEVAKDVRDGKLVAEFTYQQFKDKLNEIPGQTDFSRLAKYHAAQKQRLSEGNSDIAATEGEAAMNAGRGSSTPSGDNGNVVDEGQFAQLSTRRLKEMCAAVGLSKCGKRRELIERYRGPHPPRVWLLRKRRKDLHVPSSYNVGGSALLVALYLHEMETGGLDNGITKEDLYVKAEGLNITKNPFSGGTTQTGPYHYDGWSNMSKLLEGDPALVKRIKGRYKLTRSCELSGFSIAEAMHIWCHQHNNCGCGQEI